MRAVVIITLLVVGCADAPKEVPFDELGWRNNNTTDTAPTIRQQMLADLLRRHSFRGMSRDEVVDLLGEPSSAEPSSIGFPQWDIIYLLGLERASAFSLDEEALGFKFSPTKRVVNWGVSVN